MNGAWRAAPAAWEAPEDDGRAVKLYLDSASIRDLSAALEHGVVRGLTVNPSLLRREAGGDPVAHLRSLLEVASPHALDVHVQVMTLDPDAMIEQAADLHRRLAYEHLTVKVPAGWHELRVIAALARRGVAVNCTACVTMMQAVLAAAAGARVVTLFCGKMTDAGIDCWDVVEHTASALPRAGRPCELMVASLRKPYDVPLAFRHGADVATVPLAYLQVLADHFKSREAVESFAGDFLAI